jgi:hypothetical protein
MNIDRSILLAILALGSIAGLASAQQTPEPPMDFQGQTPPFMAQAIDEQDGCDECCADAPAGLLGGVGLYLVKPYFASNIAYTTMRDVGARGEPGFRRADDRTDIDHSFEVTPLVWLGYLDDNGWGGRARYWCIQQGTEQAAEGSAPSTGGTGSAVFSAAPLGLQVQAFANEQLIVTSKLDLQLLDLEAVRNFRAAGCDFLVCGGVRLARIKQTYNAFLGTEGKAIDSVQSEHKFEGAGPVLASEVRYALGDSAFALVGKARGAMLFGDARQNAFLESQHSSGSDTREKGMLVGEVDLGVEYGWEIGGAYCFGQVALVGQNWFGAGGASRATPEVVPGGGFDARGSFVQDSDIAFLGVAFLLGMNY